MINHSTSSSSFYGLVSGVAASFSSAMGNANVHGGRRQTYGEMRAGDYLLDAIEEFKAVIKPLLEEIAASRNDPGSMGHPGFQDLDAYEESILLPYADGELTGFCLGARRGHHFDGAGLSLDVPTPLYPVTLESFPSAVDEMWRREFGEPYDERERIENAFDDLVEALDFARAIATFDDFFRAVRTSNNELVELLCDVRDPRRWRAREIDGLFERTEHRVRVRDERKAFLTVTRPRNREGEIDEGYLVGEDDAGFFIHSVDITNLGDEQDVTMADVREAIGFDRSLPDGTEQFDFDGRIRVQGDFCLERVGEAAEVDPNDQCNIPIDNHLALVSSAVVVGERDAEPVEVIVPETAHVHVIHDEHRPLSFALPAGRYEFSLLERGIRPEGEHPEW